LFASELRARAEQVLARAEIMHDAEALQVMRDVAASYEKLAQRLENEGGEAWGRGAPAMTRQLTGKRILIVEDESMIAEILKIKITEEGGEVIGPVETVDAALDAIATTSLDGATVDIKLMGQMTFLVADVLAARYIPFLFVTGHGQHVPPRHAKVRRLQKPVAPFIVCRALEGAMISGAP
jgi:CheY-like chemotaxis protein